MDDKDLIALTADIVAAHVANNAVAVSDLPLIIQEVHSALNDIAAEPSTDDRIETATSIRASVKSDYLICLVCGRKHKTLRRHLGSAHDMSAAEYRGAFNLRADYPLVAANYSKKRSELAKSIGLGRKLQGTSSNAAGKPNSRAKPRGKRPPVKKTG